MGTDNFSDDLCSFSVLEESGTSFKILSIAPTSIEISYSTIDGNQPGLYGNYLAIWQSGSSIPWKKTPDATQSISDSTQTTGTISFDGVELTDESYIIGYSVVPQFTDINNFCVSGRIHAKEFANGEDIQALKISLEGVSSNTVRVHYEALTSYSPADNQNWIGIWKGNPDLYTAAPKYAVKVDQTEDSGIVTFNNLKMLRDSTYTVGYFMNGWNNEIPNLVQHGLAYKITFRT